MLKLIDLEPEIQRVRALLASENGSISAAGVAHVLWQMNDYSDFKYEHGKLNDSMRSLYEEGKMSGGEIMSLRNEREYAEQYLSLLRVQEKLNTDSEGKPLSPEQIKEEIEEARKDLLQLYTRQDANRGAEVLARYEEATAQHMEMLIPEAVKATITATPGSSRRVRGGVIHKGENSMTAFPHYSVGGNHKEVGSHTVFSAPLLSR